MVLPIWSQSICDDPTSGLYVGPKKGTAAVDVILSPVSVKNKIAHNISEEFD